MDYNSCPRVNAIFRNQPSYTYFNKSIADPRDNVYLLLHEIESHFMEPQQLADKRCFENVTIVDPRNQKLVTDIVYDYTTTLTTKAFHSPRASCLNGAQHSIGMRVVKARQDGTELAEDDYLIWHRMESKCLKETQQFQKFVYEYNQTNKELIYSPARQLMDLYKQWYGRKAERLLKKCPEVSYNTHLGLPHLRVCKDALKEQWAEIVEVQVDPLVNMLSNKEMNMQNIKRKLEMYCQDFVDSESRREQLEEEAKNDFVKSTEAAEEFPLYFIPFDSLLFLLTAGDYLDLPMEMLLDIKERDTDQKYLVMDLPLPPRQMGWHTWKQVAEQAAMSYLSRISEHQTDKEKENEVFPNSDHNIPYELKTIEEYMESYGQRDKKYCQFSQTNCKWQLKAKEKDLIQSIHTIVPTNLTKDSIKLEYKPTFGCELQTKYELLREWFKLKLLNKTSSTCHRLDVNNFQTLLAESQTLDKLQFQLSTMYHIQIPQLLCNLYEFLNLLTQMPCGHYMLRFNPKFRDKFMLCKPSDEITQNTIHLHQLLKTEPSELLFMAQQSYLPIADNLCSLMHVQHKLIPCTFRPMARWRHEKLQKNEKGNANDFIINDRKCILNKIEKKKKAVEDRLSALRKARKKKTQRENRIKRKLNQNNEEKDLQREIEFDQQIIGS
uniref:Little elongation complex subunit 2 C-terminal domain-containing protein n=1 Tax=Musca domestica TaxID=7370 RepID=A0A1I8M6T1_MUSDO